MEDVIRYVQTHQMVLVAHVIVAISLSVAGIVKVKNIIIGNTLYCCMNILTDINECAVTSGICGADKICTNTVGGYRCECNIGYWQLSNGDCQGMERYN